MTDAEYFKERLAEAFTESGKWERKLRDAVTQKQIEFCQLELNAAQKRIFDICNKLEGIKQCQTPN